MKRTFIFGPALTLKNSAQILRWAQDKLLNILENRTGQQSYLISPIKMCTALYKKNKTLSRQLFRKKVVEVSTLTFTQSNFTPIAFLFPSVELSHHIDPSWLPWF